MIKKITFLAFFLLAASANAQIQRVEPPFWWSGMKMNELQLMFYGKDIAKYEVSVENGVTVNDITKTENPNYVFVTLDTRKMAPGTIKINFQKNGKTAFSQNYEFKKRRDNSASRLGFNTSDVIYLLMPDRFSNGNPENDTSPKMVEKADRSKPGGRHGGDIQGIIDHLDYIDDLGATAVWSTPLLEDNDSTYSYHTYAQSDVYNIDPRYGTNEDYKRLGEELHKRDMKLIMDYVTNHWGSEHWMVKDLPTYSWLHQFPGYAQSNYQMTTQMDPHASKHDLRYCADGWFTKTMPDLNQSNPLVLNYLIENAIWWIEYANLDGLRVDTYSYNDKEGIAKWTKAIMDEYPNFNITGEVWMHDQAQISYWQKNSPIGAIENFDSHLPTLMDFTLHDAISGMFNEENNAWGQGMVRAYQNFVNDFLYANPNNMLVFLANHDTNRFNEIYDGDIDIYKLGLTLILTTRGIPEIYYGDEIGMRGDKGKGDGDIRRDFPGGWNGDPKNAFTAEGRSEMQNEYHDFTKKLLNYRKNSEILQEGKLLQFLPENNVYVYFRYTENKRVMVVLNNNPEEQQLELNRFAEGLNGKTSGVNILTGKHIALSGSLNVSGKTPVVIELE